jgi:hypothetical protein
VTAGSDLDRLIKGIKRQVSFTLLDLNQRLSEGVQLTDQQDTCLGSFDPGAGEQLLAIDCVQALATGDIVAYVSGAAFYATDACHASLFDKNTDNCILQNAAITLPAKWTYSQDERRPVLVYSETEITYAITDTMYTSSVWIPRQPNATLTFSVAFHQRL